jgi:hypothetical protein
VIEFLCPNGHKIHCPEEQAGRAAKCPRCGVKFRIPQPSEVNLADAADDESDVGRAELSDSDISSPAATLRQGPQDEEEPLVEFLCPNGHRLHGPASLQGQPGECPECGSRFRIPTYDDIPEDETADQRIGVGRADGGEDSDLVIEQDESEQQASLKGTVDERGDTAKIPRSAVPTETEPVAMRHPLAQLVATLWPEKANGATIELRLVGGEILVPDQFAVSLSCDSYGVFAVKDPDGKYTLTALAWEAIERVVVRGVETPPSLR